MGFNSSQFSTPAMGYSFQHQSSGAGFSTRGAGNWESQKNGGLGQDTSVDIFDESAFERAFDAARKEIVAEQDLGQDTSKQNEKVDTGGVDIYPGRKL